MVLAWLLDLPSVPPVTCTSPQKTYLSTSLDIRHISKPIPRYTEAPGCEYLIRTPGKSNTKLLSQWMYIRPSHGIVHSCGINNNFQLLHCAYGIRLFHSSCSGIVSTVLASRLLRMEERAVWRVDFILPALAYASFWSIFDCCWSLCDRAKQ